MQADGRYPVGRGENRRNKGCLQDMGKREGRQLQCWEQGGSCCAWVP